MMISGNMNSKKPSNTTPNDCHLSSAVLMGGQKNAQSSEFTDAICSIDGLVSYAYSSSSGWDAGPKRPSNASQLNTTAEDVGNILCSIPSPPNTPDESLSPLSTINSGNFNPSPNFLESKKYDDNLSIEFSNGDQWCGFLPSNETLAIEKVEWDSVQFLREDIVALLELGETLNVTNLVVVMPKFIKGLTELIHSFMYVGGALVDLKTTGWGIKDDYIAFSMQI